MDRLRYYFDIFVLKNYTTGLFLIDSTGISQPRFMYASYKDYKNES